MIFDSLWKSFDSRFNGILESLIKHKEILNKEVVTIDVAEVHSWRAKQQEEIEIREMRRLNTYIHDTIAWLGISTIEQVDRLDELVSRRLDGTCQWIFRNEKFRAWKDDALGEPVLWVKGIPGSGLSMLTAFGKSI